jgi:predicted unusual protein kinase regulating ubiquinone biosynthesis (AarF/ABC1/UbiB family)
VSTSSNVPRGRLSRIARIGLIGARLGASRLIDGHEASAKAASEVLGTLRGLASKVGQMASYVDGVVPEGQRDAYEASMASLRSHAPTSRPDKVRALVEAELGKPIGELFETWEDIPFASASIGQVHRAVLPGGREVAVKVQHPGIAKAVESDLSNVALLETVFTQLVGKNFHAGQLLEEAKTRFREELDYGLEASRQNHFARLFADDPRTLIPEPIPSHCSARVLTADFMRGLSFEEAIVAPARDREAWAETLWRFVFRGNLVGGMFNADPHPGNYLFQPEGRIAFLDFGCVQPLLAKQHRHAVTLHRFAVEGNEKGFYEEGVRYLEVRPGRHEEMAIGFMRRCFDPLFVRPYRVKRDYVASLVKELHASALEARKLDAKDVAPLPKGTLFMNRLQFGFYSVLARLDVELDYAAIERSFLPEAEAAIAKLEPSS